MTQNCLPIVDWLKNWFTSTEDLLDKTYPVGSIYMSVNSTSPSTLFGGTWVQLEDTFLYATSTTADDNVTTAPSGQGEASVTLTANQSGIKAHGHGMAHTHRHRHQSGRRDVYVASGQAAGAIGYSSTGSTYNLSYDETASSKSTTDNNTAQNASEPHNNMPPYMKVFMWKRTA